MSYVIRRRRLFTLRLLTRMLDDLEANVDRTDSKLSNAMRRMKKFVRDTEGKFEPAYMYSL